MGQINRSTVVACPPERVFALLADVERLPEFSSMTVEVRGGPGRAVQVGDRFEQVVRLLGKELESAWEVVEVRAPSLLRVDGTGPAGSSAQLTERLSPLGDGTRVELEVDYDPPLGVLGEAVDALFLHGKMEDQADEILERLKSLCEGSS